MRIAAVVCLIKCRLRNMAHAHAFLRANEHEAHLRAYRWALAARCRRSHAARHHSCCCGAPLPCSRAHIFVLRCRHAPAQLRYSLPHVLVPSTLREARVLRSNSGLCACFCLFGEVYNHRRITGRRPTTYHNMQQISITRLSLLALAHISWASV